MTKKIMNIVNIIIIVAVMITAFSNTTYAGAETVDDTMRGAQKFLEEGKDMSHQIGGQTETNVDFSELNNISKFIYNMLLGIALVAAVVVGMILGVKMMTAGIEEKAKIKETLVPYGVSCVVIFGAFGIWRLAVTILATW